MSARVDADCQVIECDDDRKLRNFYDKRINQVCIRMLMPALSPAAIFVASCFLFVHFCFGVVIRVADC
jgi:hypothetical protein